MASDDRIATWQIVNTVVPLALCAFGLSAVTTSFDLTSVVMAPLFFVLIILLMSRSFSLMHDCGHQSLFGSKRVNRFVAFWLRHVCSRLSTVRFANGPKRSMVHLLGGEKIIFFNSRY